MSVNKYFNVWRVLLLSLALDESCDVTDTTQLCIYLQCQRTVRKQVSLKKIAFEERITDIKGMLSVCSFSQIFFRSYLSINL
jgi:hypothetical protein